MQPLDLLIGLIIAVFWCSFCKRDYRPPESESHETLENATTDR